MEETVRSGVKRSKAAEERECEVSVLYACERDIEVEARDM